MAEAVSGVVSGDPDTGVSGVAFDSRRVMPGDLFCCVPGHASDGHDFADTAVRAGAVALLVERVVDVDTTQIHVPAVRAAMGRVAALVHGDPSRHLRLVGVTGTNGKTTTTHMVGAIAEAGGLPACLTGTVETRIAGTREAVLHTTPEAPDLHTLLARMVTSGCDVAAMEVSSHALDQDRIGGVHFAVGAFTNLSQDHLDYHGTMERYFASKLRLFEAGRCDRAVVGVDEAWGVRVAEVAGAAGIPTTTFGSGPAPAGVDIGHLRVSVESVSLSGTVIGLDDGAGYRRVRLGMGGGHNALNAACAAACARALGLVWESVVAGLEGMTHVPGRFEAIDCGQPFRVVVDYAHTPDAVESVLAAARDLVAVGGRLVVVVGCGGDRDREKRPLMGAAATRLADVVLVTSDNPRSEDPERIIGEMITGIDDSGAELRVVVDRREAIRAALQTAQAGDVVVIAGKGHEQGQDVAGVIHPFDDRVVAREELGAIGFPAGVGGGA
ncbi:MAG: UDP-N-acetylmuramoyl-L-alanyl-D-glutamate--2,6-diaminopimelate ligase [Acidimicrobiia bacterium]|nr:UDP-N-acetylmuramoyl-L-alanyl-D-glutamate--2,6-diaminopimelate ligase [Acidimicrobiia bacterium]